MPGFLAPEFELVALHPHHLIPNRDALLVYDASAGINRLYVPTESSHLRCITTNSSLPAFLPPIRDPTSGLNVFLVALNAEIKFRRFKLLFQGWAHLSPDHAILAELTIKLVSLLYWRPRTPAKGSRGEQVLLKAKQEKPHRGKPRSTFESSDENGNSENEASTPTGDREQHYVLPTDVDLETRIAYGRALMCGHGVFS